MQELKFKICTNCKEEKEISFFGINKSKKDGLQFFCKECRKNESKQRKEYRKNYYMNNKEKILEVQREYYSLNKDKINKRCADYYNKNTEKTRKKINEYYQKHKKEIFQKQLKKINGDPCLKLKSRISIMVCKYIKKAGSKKDFPTWSKLPYTPQQLKEYLEKQFDDKMNWENYGKYWTLDHIIPQSKLLYDSMDHPNFLKCWKLENLRPMKAEDNIRKSNK